MTIEEYQQKAHSTAVHGGTLAYPIAALSEETGEVCAVYGAFNAQYPTAKLNWLSVRAKLQDELGDVLWNVAELATLLKLDLDTEVFAPAQKLSKKTHDLNSLVFALPVYVGKLNGVWAKYIRKHNGEQPSPDDVATNNRIGSEKDIGPSMRVLLIAISSAIFEVMMRCEISLIATLEGNINKLAARQKNNTLGGKGSVDRKE